MKPTSVVSDQTEACGGQCVRNFTFLQYAVQPSSLMPQKSTLVKVEHENCVKHFPGNNNKQIDMDRLVTNREVKTG